MTPAAPSLEPGSESESVSTDGPVMEAASVAPGPVRASGGTATADSTAPADSTATAGSPAAGGTANGATAGTGTAVATATRERAAADVGSRAADRVAGRKRQARPYQHNRRDLRFHVHPPYVTETFEHLLTLFTAVCQMNDGAVRA